MFIDALIIGLIQTTPFTYKEDCHEMHQHHIDGYHRVIEYWEEETPEIIYDKESMVNMCNPTFGIDLVVHELGHELHHIIRSDSDYALYIEVFHKLHEMSKLDIDYTSQYAQMNENIDLIIKKYEGK